MKFVVLMVAFLLAYFAQHGQKSLIEDLNKGFTAYLDWFSKQFTSNELSQGWGGTLMFALVPALLLGLLIHFISGGFLLVVLVLHVAVLLVCIVPVDPQFIDAVTHEDASENTNEEQQIEKKLIAGFSVIQIVSVVFWYFLVGPVGALMMRLLFTGQQSPKLQDTLSTLLYIAKWVPVRLLILSYALVGNFHGVITATGQDCLRMDKDSLKLEQKAAESALWPHFDELEADEAATQLAALYRRALLCWLTMITLISITL